MITSCIPFMPFCAQTDSGLRHPRQQCGKSRGRLHPVHAILHASWVFSLGNTHWRPLIVDCALPKELFVYPEAGCLGAVVRVQIGHLLLEHYHCSLREIR